jgi:HTH-type transcriptional regulator/antitoxin HigA
MGKYTPFINLGPGDTIREELEHYGWEQKDLAEILGITEKHVSHLVKNKVPVTYDTACQLAKVFQQSPQFWLNLDANYRQRMQESAKEKETAARALIYRYMPVRELRQVIDLPRKTDELIAAVKNFWGVEALDFGFLEAQTQACFRKSEAYTRFNPYYALTWLQLARNSLAGNRPKAKYDRERLMALTDRLTEYTVMKNGVQQFIEGLARCGTVFLHIGYFQQTYTDGASFFDGGRPVIVYTARHNRIDNFWFTVAHELGHILLHEENQGQVFIDSLDHLDLSDQREKEADDFAGEKLKNKQILAAFKGMRRPSAIRIQSAARELGVHPGVVAGCLQHHKKAAWTSFHQFKSEVRSVLKGMK